MAPLPILVCLAAVVWLAPLTVGGQAPARTLDSKTFDVPSDPGFKNYKQIVTQFANKRRPQKENNFCILGFITNETKSAWVLWREGRELILWEEGSNLERSRRVIHLKSDVVANEKALHGSTYLVTKLWVDDLVARCDRSGIQVRVSREGDAPKHQGTK